VGQVVLVMPQRRLGLNSQAPPPAIIMFGKWFAPADISDHTLADYFLPVCDQLIAYLKQYAIIIPAQMDDPTKGRSK
jgi:hypothetical protein